MTDNNSAGLVRIRRALISVSDKTGIVDFARELKTFDVEIISTGGTAKILRDGGIDVLEVSDVTGFPEMMGGRVKTLHPKIHGGLLALRDNSDHLAAMERNAIQPIDMVVINLYPFEEALKKNNISYELYMYEGVNHAFHNDTSASRYNEAAAKLAWKRTMEFFEKHVK